MAPVIAFVGAIIFGTAAGASAAYVIAVNLARVAILSLVNKLAAPKIDLTQSAANKMLTIRATVQAQSFTYGTDMLSGPLIFANTTGDGNKELTRLVALHGREIDDIINFRIDDTNVIIGIDIADRSDDVTGGVFEGVMSIDTRLGTAVQTAIPDLVTRYPSLWTAGGHRARTWSLMYTRMTIAEGNTAYQNGIPQNMRALCKGHRVYDPRLDDTNGGTGPHRFDDDTTWEFSENPALCLSDFLRFENVGYSEVNERIDWPLVIIAADICDEQVVVPTPPALQKRYTCNFTFLATTPREQVKEMLETAMLGRTVFSQGIWKMWAGAVQTPDVTLSEVNMSGASLQVQAQSGSTAKYNRIRGKFVDPSRNFTANAYPEFRNAAFEAEDGGAKYQIFDINTCNDPFEAQRDAIIKLCQSRQQRVVVFPGNWSCFRIQPGTVVELDIAELGFTGEKFFVTEWAMQTDGSGVQLTMVEEIDSCWDDPAVNDYVTRTATGELIFSVFGNCKLSGDNIFRTVIGGGCSSGYKLRADGVLEYQLATGAFTEAGVPINEWMIQPLTFWQKTEQISGDTLDVESDALSVCESLSVDRQFGIDQGTPGVRNALLETEIFLDDACTILECGAQYNLKAEVRAPIFVRSSGAIWDKDITGGATLPQPGQKVVGDDLFAFTVGAGVPDPVDVGVRWILESSTGLGVYKTYRRVATDDVDDDFTFDGFLGSRTMVGQIVCIANEAGFFGPAQNLILFQGGLANFAGRGEFDTQFVMRLDGGISLAEQTDPPDLASEAFNTYVIGIFSQARNTSPAFPATFSALGTPFGVDAFSGGPYTTSSGFDSSVAFGWGGRFYATSTAINGEVIPYSTVTGFTTQRSQYSRYRPN